MDIPVLFLIFNRENTALKVMSRIRDAQPKKIFIAADGARYDKPGESELCSKVRSSVMSMIDWECEVYTLFRDKNLGCGKAISGAISWFFSNVDRGIILEDDCLPSSDFFPYMEAVLNKYADNNHIGMCTAYNVFEKESKAFCRDYDCFFTRDPHIWGWGTWKRVWEKYDFDLEDFSYRDLNRYLNDVGSSYAKKLYQRNRYLQIFVQRSIDTWDYQFDFCLYKNRLLCVTPKINLVENIGISSIERSHNHGELSSGLIHERFSFPVVLPDSVSVSPVLDSLFFNKYQKKGAVKMIYRQLIVYIRLFTYYIRKR